MVVAEEFIKCCTISLEDNLGQLSHKIINKILIKKNITNDSKLNDLTDFIDLIEKNISVFSGKHEASEICNSIRVKAIPRSVNEADISELKKILSVEISKFLERYPRPEKSDVDDFIKYLDLLRSNNDTESVGKLMQTQGPSYLIKDEKGFSDESLTEFMRIVTPSESDMKGALEGMGLKHLIKGKNEGMYESDMST